MNEFWIAEPMSITQFPLKCIDAASNHTRGPWCFLWAFNWKCLPLVYSINTSLNLLFKKKKTCWALNFSISFFGWWPFTFGYLFIPLKNVQVKNKVGLSLFNQQIMKFKIKKNPINKIVDNYDTVSITQGRLFWCKIYF